MDKSLNSKTVPESLVASVTSSYIITDEKPKEGDYAVNTNNKKNKPRLVERFSEENNTLGFHQPESWFSWCPLRDYHLKVIFV